MSDSTILKYSASIFSAEEKYAQRFIKHVGKWEMHKNIFTEKETRNVKTRDA